MIGLRLSPESRSRIERWAAKQIDKPNLSEAIRQLVEIGLASALSESRRTPKAAAKATQMAGREIERIADKSAPPEVRAKRKRRLTHGPREFRALRKD